MGEAEPIFREELDVLLRVAESIRTDRFDSQVCR